MSEGQRWLWYFHSMNALMHYNTLQWLREAGIEPDLDMAQRAGNLMRYWQETGQYHNAVAHQPNLPGAPFVHREQINPCPPPLPTYEF